MPTPTITADRGRPAAGASMHRRRSMVAIGLVACVLSLGLASCGHSSTGIARLSVNGQVQVTPAHGKVRPGHSGDVLGSGDRIQVVAGDAALSFLSGGVLMMRDGTQLTVAKTPYLTVGAVLVQPARNQLRVAAERATFDVPSGVAQLAVGPVTANLTAKVYQATSMLMITGNPPTPIRAPREVVLTPSTQLPVAVTPIQYQSSDPWDYFYLSSAETIAAELAAASTGFDAQLAANAGTTASFYQQLLPALAGRTDFVTAFEGLQQAGPSGTVQAAKPGDYLIASVIALRGTEGTFADRLRAELLFFSQGANWGLVAYDQGVTNLAGVLSDVLAAIGRAALPFAGAPTSQIAIGPPTTTPPAATHHATRAPSPSPTPTTTTLASPRPAREATTTTTLPSDILPVPVLPGPLGSILDPLLDPLIQALDNILAGRG